jgi:hypothetical protein
MMGAKVPSLDTRIAQPSPKIVDPFYLSPEWRGLMARIIKQRGRRCEDRMCKTPGRTGMRVFGDHVIELKDGGAPLDEGNVLLRCGSCHTRKTAEARAARAMR